MSPLHHRSQGKCEKSPSSWRQSHTGFGGGSLSVLVSCPGRAADKRQPYTRPEASSAAEWLSVAGLSVWRNRVVWEARAGDPAGRRRWAGTSGRAASPAGRRLSDSARGSGTGTGSSPRLHSACWRQLRIRAAGPPGPGRPCCTLPAAASSRPRSRRQAGPRAPAAPPCSCCPSPGDSSTAWLLPQQRGAEECSQSVSPSGNTWRM